MIFPEKNLYISNDFEFFDQATITLDHNKHNLFLTDTNISAQLKNHKIISDIYNSNIFQLSFKFEDVKKSLNDNSYYEILDILNNYIHNSDDNHYKSINNWKHYLSSVLFNEIEAKSFKRKSKYIKYPLEIFLVIQKQFLNHQKLYIKEFINNKKNECNNLLLVNIFQNMKNISFLQANFGSNLESYISRNGIKGEISTHKIHSYNHFTLSFINNCIIDSMFDNNNIKSCNTAEGNFHLLFRYFETTLHLLFNTIKQEINEIIQNFSSVKNFSFRKYQNETINFLKDKNYNLITLIIIEYMLNYNLITQKYSKNIPKQLEGFGSNGIVHQIKYQNTILDLTLFFLSLCFFKKTNWKIFFVTNDQGYILLKELYNINIPISKNKIYYVDGDIINTNYPNHQLQLIHNINDNNYIKIIESKKYTFISRKIKDIVVPYFDNKKYIL